MSDVVYIISCNKKESLPFSETCLSTNLAKGIQWALGILRDTEFKILIEDLVELGEVSAILLKSFMYFFMMFLCMTWWILLYSVDPLNDMDFIIISDF